MHQLEFTASQYKFYETPDVCAVCGEPCVTFEDYQMLGNPHIGYWPDVKVKAKKFAVADTTLLWGKKKAKVWVKLCLRHMQQLGKPKVVHKFNPKKPSKEQMRLFE